MLSCIISSKHIVVISTSVKLNIFREALDMFRVEQERLRAASKGLFSNAWLWRKHRSFAALEEEDHEQWHEDQRHEERLGVD